MRVAFVTDLYVPWLGGQQVRFQELARRLASRGHSVTVYCVRHDRDLAPVDQVEGVTIRRAPLSPRYDRPLVPATNRAVIATFRFAWAVRAALKTADYDVVYFNQWPYLHVLAATPTVRCHAAIDWCELRHGTVYFLAQRYLPRMVAHNLCVNDVLAERLTEQSGATVGYLPSGITAARYRRRPAGERHGLLYLGRLVNHKNVPLLIEAYAELWRRGVRDPLRIAGDGPDAHLVHAALARLVPDARACVEVLGTVYDEDKIELLASASVLVVPSRREGFPNVVAEAMISGLPTATIEAPENGTSHVVRRYGVGTVGAPTPRGLADAIEEALTNRDSFVVDAEEVAAELDWDRLVDRFLGVFTSGAVASDSDAPVRTPRHRRPRPKA